MRYVIACGMLWFFGCAPSLNQVVSEQIDSKPVASAAPKVFQRVREYVYAQILATPYIDNTGRFYIVFTRKKDDNYRVRLVWDPNRCDVQTAPQTNTLGFYQCNNNQALQQEEIVLSARLEKPPTKNKKSKVKIKPNSAKYREFDFTTSTIGGQSRHWNVTYDLSTSAVFLSNFNETNRPFDESADLLQLSRVPMGVEWFISSKLKTVVGDDLAFDTQHFISQAGSAEQIHLIFQTDPVSYGSIASMQISHSVKNCDVTKIAKKTKLARSTKKGSSLPLIGCTAPVETMDVAAIESTHLTVSSAGDRASFIVTTNKILNDKIFWELVLQSNTTGSTATLQRMAGVKTPAKVNYGLIVYFPLDLWSKTTIGTASLVSDAKADLKEPAQPTPVPSLMGDMGSDRKPEPVERASVVVNPENTDINPAAIKYAPMNRVAMRLDDGYYEFWRQVGDLGNCFNQKNLVLAGYILKISHENGKMLITASKSGKTLHGEVKSCHTMMLNKQLLAAEYVDWEKQDNQSSLDTPAYRQCVSFSQSTFIDWQILRGQENCVR